MKRLLTWHRRGRPSWPRAARRRPPAVRWPACRRRRRRRHDRHRRNRMATDRTTTERRAGGSQEAPLEFAKCMREHGVDMPDPTVRRRRRRRMSRVAIRRAEWRPASDGPDPKDLERPTRTASTSWRMRRAQFDPPSEEDQTKMQEQALAFAKCMREHGIDMPDPTVLGDGVRHRAFHRRPSRQLPPTMARRSTSTPRSSRTRTRRAADPWRRSPSQPKVAG